MSRNQVLSTVAALVITGCIATAQTSVTNIFDNLNKVIPDGQLTGMSDTEHLTFDGPGMASIDNLQVMLTIANGYNGDFYAYLVHDDGFSVLLNRVGRTTGNAFGYSDSGMNVLFSASGLDIHGYQSESPIITGGDLTGTWAPDGRNVDPESILGSEEQTALLGSFNGTNPNGDWTLFLADLDFGEQGTLVKWGLIVTSVPEPSTWTLLALGGFGVGMNLLRRKRAG